MGNRDDAADVLQDVFIKVLTRVGEIGYRGEGTLRSWILRVAVNESLNALRHQMHFDDAETLTDVHEEEEPDVGKVPLDVLMNFIARLPDGYRTVFNMFVMERMGHKEIARQLGIGVSSSASQLLRAKRILAREINEYIKQTEG
jgi:RNA polymerase sigma-70 factor (ECF subfamily)